MKAQAASFNASTNATRASTDGPTHGPMNAPSQAPSGTSSKAAGQRDATRRSPPVPPQQRDAFESALRRLRQDDEPQAQGPAASLPWGQPLPPTPTAPAAQEQPSGAAVAGAPPRTAAAQDAVSTHLRALGAVPSSASPLANASAHSAALTPIGTDATAVHWQMQWAGAAAPVQQVDLHRSETGALQLDMTGQAYASDPARLARLRDRVAARAQTGEVFVLAHTPDAPGHRGPSRRTGQSPFDDEGDAT
jgi:hypothetical protein